MTANCGTNKHVNTSVLPITTPIKILHYIPKNASIHQHQVIYFVRAFDALVRNDLYLVTS